ncbi:MAG: NAD(P)/FAD-dependent oxidoreductase [Desulfatibacillaceae bacterium]
MTGSDYPGRVDVLVAGAGPAGLTVALHLAGSGMDVLVVDSRRRIGSPVRCSGLVEPPFFRVLGEEPRPDWIRWQLQSGELALDRERMEYGLSGVLAGRGVHVRPATAVSAVGPFDNGGREVALAHDGGTSLVRAGCVVAADGAPSSVARLAGLDTRLPVGDCATCFGWELEDARVADRGVYHVEPLPDPYPGYPFLFWVLATGEDSANVGLAVRGHHGYRAKRLAERMLEETDACHGGRIVRTILGFLPLPRPLNPPYTDGLLVCGTAARLVDPLKGAGILHAAASGRVAAMTLRGLEGLEATSERLASYQQGIAPIVGRIYSRWQTWERCRGRCDFFDLMMNG